MKELTKIAGIDFGSKLAGTTCIAFIDQQQILHVLQSEKNHSADTFLQDVITDLGFQRIFIDAPLTLPQAYSGHRNGSSPDFHFRNCDREVGGMSPMFLGGLTARAIHLKHQLESKGVEVYEVYPAYIANTLYERFQGYKEKAYKTKRYWNHIKASFPIRKIDKLPENWHQIDAILALLSGIRFVSGSNLAFGKEEEGLILV